MILLISLSSNAQVIGIETLSYPSDKNEEWDFLQHKIKDCNIVCLGEENHWIETYLEVKNGIIKNLNLNKNFDVLIFESGFINSFIANKERLISKERLKETMYELWQTKATNDLINYIDVSRNSTHSITQLGCDIKGPKSFRFSRFISKSLKGINDSLSVEMSKMDSSFVELRFAWEPEIGKAFRGKYLADKTYEKFRNNYLRLIDSLANYEDKLKLEQNLEKIEFDYYVRCLNNRLYLLELMQLPTYQEKHKYRDEKMGENLKWLIEEYLPGKRYIIWGADIHISKDAKWEEMGKEWTSNKSMIEWLSLNVEEKIFSIGIKKLKALSKKNRKEICKSSSSKYYYLNKKSMKEMNIYKDEHDGLILCRKTKSIKNYKIK